MLGKTKQALSPSPTQSGGGGGGGGGGKEKDGVAVTEQPIDYTNLPEGKGAEYQSKADELAGSVESDSIPGSRSFIELSLYEKKSVLINRELDAMGMGRYQWCIFFLCGFGYFLDLCWAQAGGLVGSAIIQELDVDDNHVGDLSTAFNVGLTVGAFTWGLLVDIVGRRWCFNITCLIASIFGFLFAAPSNYAAICFFYCMIGFGVGGNIPIDATITLEFLPKNRRFLLAALSTFQPIGVVVASVISYGLIPKYSCPCLPSDPPACCHRSNNMGWRYTMITLGAITLFIFALRFVAFHFRESPKFLLSKGHDAHALDILYSVAKFNKVPPPRLTLEDFHALEFEESQRMTNTSTVPLGADPQPVPTGTHAKQVAVGSFFRIFGHLRGLFATKVYQYLFVVMAVAYMADFWAFNIAGYFLPLILRAKGVNTSQSIDDTYRSYVWISDLSLLDLPGVTAPILAAALMEIPRLGRKWAMVISALLMGVSMALYQVVNSLPANIGFNAMEYWFQSLYNALLYGFTPEAFPAPFRGSAAGMLSTLGRIAGIIAPIATTHVYHGSSSPGVLWLGAGGAWVSAIAIALLPYETKGKQTY
ncbi:major facilitator superfamily domain-containing protein [Kockovaella imperatae]|uniref:Major facilitator superfamily domain-containing protein n=1 Tax=Kockovaella imperatae TaxID=4999 RepID=A0A1Y1UKP0_9TREE|nr:major facilitator superfamily domain-containing protein [Kockovaella imperatae]ORX38559.1 major facilitator superfamily domain-containing protein [Kockovaella imperatae]